MNEAQTIRLALEQLFLETGVKATWKQAPTKADYDATADLVIHGQKTHFVIEAKKEVRQLHLPQILKMAGEYQPLLVIGEKIYPAVKDILKQNDVAYLDTAGNMYINTPGKFILIEGKKAKPDDKVSNRAFTKKGLRTVFYFLLHPEAINLPYRRLAEATGVALGNIPNIIEGLKDANFILHVDKRTMQLQNKKALLERWVTAYGEVLKPALLLGKYRLWDQQKMIDWRLLPIERGESHWGGEPAAELLTNYLQPKILTMYTTLHRAAIIPKWTLIPTDDGEVELYEKFWKEPEPDYNEAVPPLLVYADLMLTNDARCIETAYIIYNQYLRNEFE